MQNIEMIKRNIIAFVILFIFEMLSNISIYNDVEISAFTSLN